jgi:predicted GNAT family N-acyltransferase
MKDIVTKQVTWQAAEGSLKFVRTLVFIDEQLVTPEFEWDDIDQNAVHVLAMVNNAPIACLRIIDYKKIGRMAVLKEWRRKGVGMAILRKAIDICKQHGSAQLYLSAQTHAIGFYKQAGFIVTSDIYQDLHIPHVDMQLTLSEHGLHLVK